MRLLLLAIQSMKHLFRAHVPRELAAFHEMTLDFMKDAIAPTKRIISIISSDLGRDPSVKVISAIPQHCSLR